MNYEQFAIGTKIQSYDSYGYFVMPLCGIIEKHLGGGHAIIRSFDESYYSTVGHIGKVQEIEAIAITPL